MVRVKVKVKVMVKVMVMVKVKVKVMVKVMVMVMVKVKVMVMVKVIKGVIYMKTIKVSEETYKSIESQLKSGDKVIEPIKELKDLIGKTFTFWCVRYIYHGTVKSVNDFYVILEDAGVVYDTGDLDASSAEDKQDLPNDLHIPLHAIENFTQMNW